MASHPICLHCVVTSSEYDEELELYTLNPEVKSMNRSDTLLWPFSSTHEDEADLTGQFKLSLSLPWTCPSASCWPDWKYSCKKEDAYKITLGWKHLRDKNKSKLLKWIHKYKPNKLKNVSNFRSEGLKIFIRWKKRQQQVHIGFLHATFWSRFITTKDTSPPNLILLVKHFG